MVLKFLTTTNLKQNFETGDGYLEKRNKGSEYKREFPAAEAPVQQLTLSGGKMQIPINTL